MMSLIIRNQLDNKKRENENKQIKVQDKPSRNLSCDLFKHLLTKKRCKICRKVFNKEGENNYQAHYAKCKTLKEQKETLKKMIDDLRQTNNELNLLEALNLRNKKNRNSSYSNKVKVNKEATILSFEDKVKMLRMYIRELKIDWRQGYDSIIVDRSEIIYQSFKQFHTINPYKELKISFKGENSQDAGGLLREWLTVLFQQFLNDKLKMFQRANTDDISYIIKTNQNRNPGRTNLYYFIGQLIAKALLENITINCCFNKILYKLILEESIEYEDLIFIDKLLFHSLNKIFDYEKIEELELYYTVQYEASDGSIVTKELIEGGEDIQVTNENIEDYISLRVERIVYYQKMFVNEIKNGLYEIIPKKMLKQFTCDEFELILNGTPFIDLEDWRTHTTYIDYKNTDLVSNFIIIYSTLPYFHRL